MDSLQVKAYETLYDNLSYEIQDKILDKLLSNPRNLEKLNDIYFRRRLDEILYMYHNKIIVLLIRRNIDAARYVMSIKRRNGVDDFHMYLNPWFWDSGILEDIFISDDEKTILLCRISQDKPTLILNSIELKRKDVDYISILKRDDFDSNNLYIRMNDESSIWYKYTPGDYHF